MKFFIYFLFFIFFSANLSYSKNIESIDLFNPKKQTPNAIYFDTLSQPDKFEKNNNLTRKTGSFEVAIGELLYIKGTVTDAFGVPIEGVVIKIWQTNASGKYHSLLNPESVYLDPNFKMSGQSITNNLGEYEFVTIFPGYYKNRAPHIKMLVSNEKFGQIKTEMYFKDHPKNNQDPYFLAYTPKSQSMLIADVDTITVGTAEKGKLATFNITMDGIHQYKGF